MPRKAKLWKPKGRWVSLIFTKRKEYMPEPPAMVETGTFYSIYKYIHPDAKPLNFICIITFTFKLKYALKIQYPVIVSNGKGE